MVDIKRAEKQIHDRLKSIVAGFADCGITVLGSENPVTLYNDLLISQKHKNRVTNLFINIAHLRDDARRWARAVGLDVKSIEDFCCQNQAVKLVIEVANTTKHGIGGRSQKSSVLEYQISIQKQAGPKPCISDKIVDLFFLIADSDGNVHQSNLLASKAVNDWLIFLSGLGVNVGEWLDKLKPRELPTGYSIYSANIPEPLLQKMKEEAKQRRLSF